MKTIYIILTNTGTMLSKIIYAYTGNMYTHISIALQEKPYEFYSFGRLNPYNAFLGGFVKEGVNVGTFKRFCNTKAAIYTLQVTESQYNSIKKQIYSFSIYKKNYSFNVIGMFLVPLKVKINKHNSFYCAEFVYYILKLAHIDTNNLPKIIKPIDFLKLDNLHLIYKGYLRECEALKTQ